MHQAIAVRLGIDMKIFDTICALASDGSEVTTEQVANETGKDGLLLSESEPDAQFYRSHIYSLQPASCESSLEWESSSRKDPIHSLHQNLQALTFRLPLYRMGYYTCTALLTLSSYNV